MKAFLDGVRIANTVGTYVLALRALQTEFGVKTSIDMLQDKVGTDRMMAWFDALWGSASANTVNASLRPVLGVPVVVEAGLAGSIPARRWRTGLGLCGESWSKSCSSAMASRCGNVCCGGCASPGGACRGH